MRCIDTLAMTNGETTRRPARTWGMERGLAVLAHTPIWVYLVFALLVASGIGGLRTRVVPVWRLAIVPAIFIAWGVLSVIQRSAAAPYLWGGWIIALAAGVAIGWATTHPEAFALDAASRRVRVRGTPAYLVR